MSWKLTNLARRAGWAKPGLIILAGWMMASAARAQTNFASALVLSGDYGNTTYDNTGVKPDHAAPPIGGFTPRAPLWYQWTAPASGVVDLDTVGSLDDSSGAPLNTVLAVFTGSSLTGLDQVAANNNLFPISGAFTTAAETAGGRPETISGSGDYASYLGPGVADVATYLQLYYGPSHLRFNAQAGVTYYMAVDTQPSAVFAGSGYGQIVLNWAYKSSGVFRFATEDMDAWTGLPLYQTAQTESDYVYPFVDGDSAEFTYYHYNAPGVLVTVTRTAGSTGRAWVNYATEDGSSLPAVPAVDMPGVAGVDYTPVNGTLVFDDYEMSKTILIPIINSAAAGSGGTWYNVVFGVQLSSPSLDPLEAGDVSPARVDPTFGVAMVKILNETADPYGPDSVTLTLTNTVGTNTVITVTNFLAAFPTNPVINFEKCNYRVPEDVNDPNNPQGYTVVTIYAERSPSSTNLAAVTLTYRVNNYLGIDDSADEEWNNEFPLQPASDYAVPTPPSVPFPPQVGTIYGSNSDFNIAGTYTMVAGGTLTFAQGASEKATYQPITFTVTNSLLTKFNRDFKIELYTEKGGGGGGGGQQQAYLAGMCAETTVTILFNDEHPPAGSVDEIYNADFNEGLALIPTNVPVTIPPNDPNPGVGVGGLVNSLVVLSNNETLIAGDFASYNGATLNNGHPINNIALINSNGFLDSAFSPTSGADNGPINSVAITAGNQYVIGGNFTSFNGTSRGYVARVNANGSLDMGFNAAADGFVNAVAIQSDGKVLIGGDFQNVNGTPSAYIARLNTDGSVDASFAPSNTLTGPVYSLALALSPNYAGDIMAGGTFGVTGQSYANIARLTTNGMLDTTFSPLAGADNTVYTMAWQPDGKVVAGGAFTHFNGFPNNYLTRVNIDGSLDSTNFFPGTGADDIVWNVTLQPLDGTIYVGGQFRTFNGTHRAGFTRLYPNGTVDTTFLDTAFNQFAGLKRVYSWEVPAVYASGLQSDSNVMVGGTFNQVGGGQADANVDNTLDDELGYPESFDDANLWVEPKVRDGVRNRSSLARLIGGATLAAPGSIGFQTPTVSADKSQSVLSVGLVRTNGVLGPATANFSILPGTAHSGSTTNADYFYDSQPPQFWISWDFTTTVLTRLRGDGLFGNNGLLQNIFTTLGLADSDINAASLVTVNIYKDLQNLGNLDGVCQLANPSGADEFYLGGENIPLGVALGPSTAPFTIIDNTEYSGTVGFSSSLYVATNTFAPITLTRSNGVFGTLTMRAATINGTAVSGTDYNGITNYLVTFGQGVISNSFTITNRASGLISTNFVEKTLTVDLASLTGPSGGNAAFGITNATLRLINPNFAGYLTLSATNFIGLEASGSMTFTVNRVAGSAGTLTVQYVTTNGVPPNAATNGVDFLGQTNMLQWNNGDASSRSVSVPLLNNGTLGASKHFGVELFNPTLNGTGDLGLFYVGTPPTNSIINSTMTISNNNSYGAFQFTAPAYSVNESGGYATLTVLRTGGTAGPISINFATANGANTTAGVNYVATNGTLTFAVNQIAASFNVAVLNAHAQVGTSPFNFNVKLLNPTNSVLNSPSNTVVNIVAGQTYNFPPGSQDGSFGPGFNGPVLSLALQTNGQILAGGSFAFVDGVPEGNVARLNTDGSLDVGGFGDYGLDGGANGTVQSVICQTDGRVLIGGAFTSVNGTTRNYIARLMTDGSLDTSFSPGPGASAPVYALAETFINGARELYVGGAFSTFGGTGNACPNLARINNSGAFDPAFATGSGPNGPVYALAVYPASSPWAGDLLIGGAFTNVNGFNLGNFARLNQNGSVDTNFDLNLGANGTVDAIAIQTDGRILIGGNFTSVNGVNLNYVARLNSDGSLDTNFVAGVGVGANGMVQGIAVQADNRIVVVGQFTQANGVTRNGITRLLPNGAVDTTINFGAGANGAVDAVVIQPANQWLVIGGAFTQYNDQPAAYIARIYGGSVTGSGAFQFSSANYQVLKTGGQALITVVRTGGTSGPNPDGSGTNSVAFMTTTNGTAQAGLDYLLVVTNVSFPPGEVQETVGVPVMDDGVFTPNLTVDLIITNPTPPAVIGLQPTAVLTIINTESAVSFSAANYSVTKNVLSGFGTLDVTRLGGTNSTVSVGLITTTNGTAIPGTDFYPTNATVVFNPGVVNQQVQVPIINNSIPEGYRTVTFVLTNPVATGLVMPTNATLTIIDTVYAPGQFSWAATNYTVNESAGTASLTVLRTNGTSGTVVVDYHTIPGTAQPGVSYVNTSGSVTFNNGATSETVPIPLVQNNLVLGTVNFSVLLSLPPSTNGALLIPPTNAVVNILDKNTGFAFANATNTASEAAGSVPVEILRVGNAGNAVQVSYETHDGTASNGVNYVGVTNTLSFGVGESLRSIQIPLINQNTPLPSLYFTVTLFNPTNGTLIVAPATNTVVEQGSTAGLFFSTNAVPVLKSAGNVLISVICDNPAIEPPVIYSNGVPVNTPLTVQFGTADGTAKAGVDYVGTGGTMVFTNGAGTNTFFVPLINNGRVTGNLNFSVNLTNTTPPGDIIAPSNEVVTIIDSNTGLSFSNATFTVLKTGIAATINVFRTGYTNSTASVQFVATNGTAQAGLQFVATNGLLTFTNGITNLSFTVPVIDTTVVQPDETVLLELLSPRNAYLVPPSAATLTIHDPTGSFVEPAGSALVSEINPVATNGVIYSNATVTILFAFRDAGGNSVTNLVATLLATNGVTAPTVPGGGPPVQDYGFLTFNGHSVSQPFTFTAVGTNQQQIVATFLLTNAVPGLGTNGLGTGVFGYTIGTWNTVVSNTATIFIYPDDVASQYPSSIPISGLGGSLLKATMTLTNLTHSAPRAIDAVLVAPSELTTLIMAHCGGANSVQNVTIVFDDAATNSLPQSSLIAPPNTIVTNKPTAYPVVPPFP